jgi:hypothetical protein
VSDSTIRWCCSSCELNGIITNWQGTSGDLSNLDENAIEVLEPDVPGREPPAELAGDWQIVKMEVWSPSAFNMLGPARLRLKANGLGDVRFIAVEGGLDCRYGKRNGRSFLEFSWQGSDDGDDACGRGWAELQDDGRLAGRIFIHCGDDSGFEAERKAARPGAR